MASGVSVSYLVFPQLRLNIFSGFGLLTSVLAGYLFLLVGLHGFSCRSLKRAIGLISNLAMVFVAERWKDSWLLFLFLLPDKAA